MAGKPTSPASPSTWALNLTTSRPHFALMWRTNHLIPIAGAMPYTPTQKSLKQHADALALALQVINPDAPELTEYRTAAKEEWVSASKVCQHLQIVPRTLLRWRQEGKLTPGTEWRRKSQSNHCVYNLPAISDKVLAWTDR
jgi:hypothetical protein